MKARAFETEDGIRLENGRVRLDLVRDEDRWGLGRFFFENRPLNERPINWLLCEDNITEHSKDPFSNTHYPGAEWSPRYKGECAWIMSDGEVAVVELRKEGWLDFSFKVSLPAESSAFLFEIELRPIVPIKHELFVGFPFPEPEFLSYPYESPVKAEFGGVWTAYPEVSFSPFMFGKGKGLFLGLGYHLDQPRLTDCKLVFGPALDPELPLRAYFPGRRFGVYEWSWAKEWGGERAKAYILKFIYVVAGGSAECFCSYRRLCGYKPEAPLPPRSVEESLRVLMRSYKDSKAFISVKPLEGRAFHQRVSVERGEPPSKGYGVYVPVGANMHLGLQLYRFYRLYPEERWARDYALEIARFFTSVARREGYRVPLLFDPVRKCFVSYNARLTELGFIYCTTAHAVGTLSLLRLVEMVEEEGTDYSDWKGLCVRLGDDISRKVLTTGRLAREYNGEGHEGGFSPTPWQLIMLDYSGERFGGRFAEACERLEEWNIKTFISNFNFYGSSVDDGALSMPHPLNHDCFDAPTLALYFLRRYLKDGSPERLELAKSVAEYYWLCTVPCALAGFGKPTRGLNLEQDSYRMYDVPWHSFRELSALRKLSELTGERFYEQFFEMLVRVQLHYQLPPESPHPAFHIGLAPSPEEDSPTDCTGEPGEVFIVEFAPFFFESMMYPWAEEL